MYTLRTEYRGKEKTSGVPYKEEFIIEEVHFNGNNSYWNGKEYFGFLTDEMNPVQFPTKKLAFEVGAALQAIVDDRIEETDDMRFYVMKFNERTIRSLS